MNMRSDRVAAVYSHRQIRKSATAQIARLCAVSNMIAKDLSAEPNGGYLRVGVDQDHH